GDAVLAYARRGQASTATLEADAGAAGGWPGGASDAFYQLIDGHSFSFETGLACQASTPAAANPADADPTVPCPTADAIRFSEVFIGSASWAELRNDSALPLDLTGALVCEANTVCRVIEEQNGALAPAAHGVLLLQSFLGEAAALPSERFGLASGSTGIGCGESLTCASAFVAGFGATGLELTLSAAGSLDVSVSNLGDYGRFGVDRPAVLESDAVSAGVWVADGVVNPTLESGQSYQLDPLVVERGPNAWEVGAVSPGAP
ncbi:MAG: hypothetical protein AAF658_13540, partial [Myxococcota bacterium]